MKRKLVLEDREVIYEFTRKNVKNINIRVRSDGTVSVSSGRGVTLEQIDEVLKTKAGFILGALEKFSALEQKAPEKQTYRNGDRIWILGKPCCLRVEQGRKNRAEIEDAFLLVYVRNPDSEEERVKTVNLFLKNLCLEVTTLVCERIQPQLAHLGVPIPEVRVRSMKSRWGSCKPKDKWVTFSRQLIEAPMECVEYVVWHELIHFVHPNHSPDFYECMGSFLPDWKTRKTILNSYSYRNGN